MVFYIRYTEESLLVKLFLVHTIELNLSVVYSTLQRALQLPGALVSQDFRLGDSSRTSASCLVEAGKSTVVEDRWVGDSISIKCGSSLRGQENSWMWKGKSFACVSL